MDDKNLKENNIDNQEIIPSEGSFPPANTSSYEPVTNPTSNASESVEAPDPVNPPDVIAETPSPESSPVAPPSDPAQPYSGLSEPAPSTPSSDSVQPSSASFGAVPPSSNTPEPSPQDPLSTPKVPTPEQQTTKKPFPKKILLFASGIVLFIILAVIILPKLFGNKFGDMSFEESLHDSNSFCLQDKDKNFVLYNIDGKQLLNEKFSNCERFVNGATVVKNEENKGAIVSSEGKYLLGFDACYSLYREGTLYRCRKNDDNKTQYLSSKGKIITESTPVEAETFSLPDELSYNDKYLILERDYGYEVYGYNGGLIVSFNRPTDGSVPDKPEEDDEGQYAVVFYNKKNYILDLANEKLLTSFDDERKYLITSVDEEGENRFLIESAESKSYYASTSMNRTIKLIKNGGVAFSKDVDTNETISFSRDKIIYRDKSYEKYLLDDSGKDILKYESNYIIRDAQHFLKKTSYNSVELYSNGKTTTFNCSDVISGYVIKNDTPYRLGSCGDSKAYFYVDQDGNKINNKDYKKASDYDANGYAYVSDDGENVYLIDYSGNKVSDTYKAKDGSIQPINKSDFYIVELANESVIFRIGGGEVLRAEKYLGNEEVNKVVYVSTKSGSKYKIYNLETGKEVVTLDSEPRLRSKCFTTSSNDASNVDEVYSYTTGKMFFEGTVIFD